MFSKAFSGESMFQNIYTARGGNGMIAFGSSFPGQILALAIAPGHDIILQKAAFLAAEPGVAAVHPLQQEAGRRASSAARASSCSSLSGRGMAFAEVDGELVEYTLGPGQQIDGGHRQRAGLRAHRVPSTSSRSRA